MVQERLRFPERAGFLAQKHGKQRDRSVAELDSRPRGELAADGFTVYGF